MYKVQGTQIITEIRGAKAPIEQPSALTTEQLAAEEAMAIESAASVPFEWERLRCHLMGLISRVGIAPLSNDDITLLNDIWSQLYAESEDLQRIRRRLTQAAAFPYQQRLPVEVEELEKLADTTGYTTAWIKELLKGINQILSTGRSVAIDEAGVRELSLLVESVEGQQHRALKQCLTHIEDRFGGVRPQWSMPQGAYEKISAPPTTQAQVTERPAAHEHPVDVPLGPVPPQVVKEQVYHPTPSPAGDATEYLSREEAKQVARACFVPLEWDELKERLTSVIKDEKAISAPLSSQDVRLLEKIGADLAQESNQLLAIKNRLMLLMHFPYIQTPVPIEIKEISSLADTVAHTRQRIEELLTAVHRVVSSGEQPKLSPAEVSYFHALLDRIEGEKFADLRHRLNQAEAKFGGVKPNWESPDWMPTSPDVGAFVAATSVGRFGRSGPTGPFGLTDPGRAGAGWRLAEDRTSLAEAGPSQGFGLTQGYGVGPVVAEEAFLEQQREKEQK